MNAIPQLDWTQFLSYILTPAILLGFLVYFTRLCGRIIADYIPYVDDRKYTADFNGFLFFLAQILWPSFLAVVVYYFFLQTFIISAWIILLIVLIIFFYCLQKMMLASSKFFHITEHIEKHKSHLAILRSISPSLSSKIENWLLSPVKFIRTTVFVLILFALLAYNTESLILMAAIYFYVFLTLLLLPSNFAMSKHNLLDADLIMSESDDIKDCKIIRVNEDSIRVKQGNKILIVNRSKVLRIEVKTNHN